MRAAPPRSVGWIVRTVGVPGFKTPIGDLASPLPLGLLGAAGGCLGICAEWAFSRTGAPPSMVGRDLAVGWTFLATGLVAWWRWPTNGCGRLVTAEGFAWFVPNLRGTGNPIGFAVATVLAPLNDVILAHLVIAFPTGRLESRTSRLIVAAAYAIGLAYGLGYALIDDPARDWSPYSCRGCVANAALITPGGSAFGPGMVVLTALIVVLGIVAIGLFVRHWRRMTTTARGGEIVRWAAGAVCLGVVSTDLLGVQPLPLSTSGWMALDWVDTVGQLAVPMVLLIATIRLQLARVRVADLVLRLEEQIPPLRLRDEIASHLGDPSLQLLRWHAPSAGYVDEEGRPARLPACDGPRVVTPVDGRHGPLAAIVHDRSMSGRSDLLRTVAAAIRPRLENDGLRADLEEMRAWRSRSVEAIDRERRRIERNLHDGAQQRLLSLNLLLRRAAGRGAGGDDFEQVIAEAVHQVELVLEDLRALARGVYPAILSQAGLGGALSSLARCAPVPVTVSVECRSCPASVETTVYFLVAESLANVTKHAAASSATVRVEHRDGWLTVEVKDDGRGGANPDRGSGLRGLRDRVAAHGGTMVVETAEGGGTTVVARLPCG